jgi:hypothetical protein
MYFIFFEHHAGKHFREQKYSVIVKNYRYLCST